MNYIRHLTAFYEKVASDNRLYPSHISLYMALFQYWNLNRFENPVSICRKEVMVMCKIGSLNTYHKCLHDLHNWGYIQYAPSHNQFVGSQVSLYNFDTTTDTTVIQPLLQPWRKIDTTVAPFYKHYKLYKLYREENFLAENSQAPKNNNKISNSKKMKTDTTLPFEPEEEKRKRVAPKKEKDFVRPSQNEVRDFFKTQNYPELEAQKFFNHFESNGWKVGGKSPMIDWHAAARNWILNSPKYTTPPGPPNLTTPKNYGEPL